MNEDLKQINSKFFPSYVQYGVSQVILSAPFSDNLEHCIEVQENFQRHHYHHQQQEGSISNLGITDYVKIKHW